MSKMLFSFKDRDQSHKKLEEVLAEGKHPFASCRDDPNNEAAPYQVWDGGPEPNTPPPPPPPPTETDLEALLDKLAEKLLARLEEKARATVATEAPEKE